MEQLKKLIRKLFDGNLTDAERKELAENAVISSYLFKQSEHAPDFTESDRVNKSRIWQKVRKACWDEEEIQGKAPASSMLFIRKGWVAAASILLLLLIAGGTVWYHFSPSPVAYYASDGEVLSLVLPDSSTVWLNGNSRISHSGKFLKDRTIHLEGEGFFQVKKGGVLPFKVYFQDAVVVVKGTEFNIRTTPQLAEVTLYTGKIEFRQDDAGELHTLYPSEQIIYYPDGKKIDLKKVDTNDFDWRMDEYRFVGKRLDELLRVINRIHNAGIVLQRQEDAGELFTGTIKKTESLKEILDKICFSFDLKRRVKDGQIILY